MIGFDAGGPGGGGWYAGEPRIREAVEETWDWVRGTVTRIAEAVYDWVGEVIGTFTWVLETVELVYPVRFERWQTQADERVCPECGPLDGMVWEEGAGGPYPPLHVNCRCARALAWTEWRVRWTQEWRLRWTEWTEWRWLLTSWR